MKIRNGFISNSSSSSFVIFNKHVLTLDQRNAIFDHINYANEHDIEELKYSEDYDAWRINEKDHIIEGSTIMDNFDMDYFLELIGVSRDNFRIYRD